MKSQRRILLAALIATSTTAPASAGCLDWLFCHHQAVPVVPTIPVAPVIPYAAGYAPQPTIAPLGPPTLMGTTAAPYAAGYAPYAAAYTPNTAGAAPYAAGYAPYAAGYAGLQPSLAAQAPPYGAAPVTAYSLPLDNPSVLTGRPVMQTSATSYMGGPALPPAALAPAPQGPASWFGQTLGNNYQTSYYGVPTTSYRPVAQIDPATGAAVIVQQPCTSLTQQVQRSPYSSLQPAAAPASPYYGEPGCGGELPRYAPPTTTVPQGHFTPQNGYPPVGGYAPPSGVSQASAVAPNYGAPQYASPIPSTGHDLQPNYGGLPDPLTQPNTQPLTGYPNGASGDTAPLAAPQLDSYRPSWNSSSLPSTTPSTLEAPPLPSASIWPDRRDARSADQMASAPPSGATRDRYSDIAPIPAADHYQAPSWSDRNASTIDRDRNSVPAPASATLAEPRTANHDLPASAGSLRYASSPAPLPMLPPSAAAQQPSPRDDSGWFVVEPR